MQQPQMNTRNRSFGGWTEFYQHPSEACGCDMGFAVYRPPQTAHRRVPVLYWLSGLTCTEENFITKAGAQQFAAEHGLLLVAPDTSPRGAAVQGEDDDYDFGTGAGFYLNATRAPWADHYNMYDYVIEELPALIAEHFPAERDRQSIFGHSMGGHGALIAHLKNPGRYRSVSAFAPVCNPVACPWGEKAFSGYLGDDRKAWEAYDATHLVREHGSTAPLLIDQGDGDNFYPEQLRPESLREACRAKDVELTLRFQAGYDHSYYFIATFMGEHIAYHAAALNN